MMSVQLKIWKQLITSQLLLSAKPHITFVNICTQKTPPSTIQPQGGIAIEFLLSKCGLTDEDIPKAFRHCNYLLRAKSSQNMNEVLGLLNGCGLSNPTQIRRVVLRNPQLLFLRSESNLKPKLNFFRTFMKEEDISKLFIRDAKVFSSREEKLKSAVSLLQTLGFEGTTLSHVLVNRPRLLTTSAEKVLEAFKQAENIACKKGSKRFPDAVCALLGVGKEKLERKLHCLNSLGFSEKQVLELPGQQPRILKFSEKKMKRHVDFMVNFMGLPLNDVVKYTNLFTCSLEKRIIPRFKVIEAFKQAENIACKKGSKRFPDAVCALLGVGKEKLEQKLDWLNSFGFSEKQVLELPRRQPQILKLSEEKIKRHVDFIVNFMGLPLNDVVKYANLFTCSLEKRIIPRFKVIEALNSMHVQDLKRGIPLRDVANMTEKDFLEKYVNKNVESSYLWDIYHGREPGKLIINKETASECVSIKKIRESSESLSEPST